MGVALAARGWALEAPPEAGLIAGRSEHVLLPLFCLLLVLSGFVSGTETAIFSLDRIDILQLKSDSKGFRYALRYLLERPNDTLTTILILNNLINVAISLVGGAMAEVYFSTLSPLALAGVAFCVTSLILTFGEVVPKCVAQVTAHTIAPYAAWPTYLIATALRPVRRLMNAFIGWIFELLHVPLAGEADLVSEEELKVMLSAGRVSNLLEEEERDMILGVFELDDTYAEQIMVPRNEVLALSEALSQSEVVEKLKSAPHSRILVYRDDLDHLLGFVLAKEVLLNDPGDWHKCIREIICIPERMRLDDLLRQFRRNSTKIVAVVDEYGQVAGIVTIRDLLEEIVGDMAERHEKVVPEVRIQNDGSVSVLGRTKLADLARALSVEFPPDIGATAGGFVMNMLGQVPHEGAEVNYAAYTFRVKRMIGRKVNVIEVVPRAEEPAAAVADSTEGGAS